MPPQSRGADTCHSAGKGRGTSGPEARKRRRAAEESLPRMRARAQPPRSHPSRYVTASQAGTATGASFQNGSAEAPPRLRKIPGRPFGGCAVVAGSGGLESEAWWAPRTAGCLERCLEGTAWRELIWGAQAGAWKYGDLHGGEDRGEETQLSQRGGWESQWRESGLLREGDPAKLTAVGRALRCSGRVSAAGGRLFGGGASRPQRLGVAGQVSLSRPHPPVPTLGLVSGIPPELPRWAGHLQGVGGYLKRELWRDLGQALGSQGLARGGRRVRRLHRGWGTRTLECCIWSRAWKLTEPLKTSRCFAPQTPALSRCNTCLNFKCKFPSRSILSSFSSPFLSFFYTAVSHHTYSLILTFKDFKVGNLLGKGSFAGVYRAESIHTGLEVAIKMVRIY